MPIEIDADLLKQSEVKGTTLWKSAANFVIQTRQDRSVEEDVTAARAYRTPSASRSISADGVAVRGQLGPAVVDDGTVTEGIRPPPSPLQGRGEGNGEEDDSGV